MISHGERECSAPSRISLEVGLIKAVPRDRGRLNKHFFNGYRRLKTRGGVVLYIFPFQCLRCKVVNILLQNNRFRRTVNPFSVKLQSQGLFFYFSKRLKCYLLQLYNLLFIY